jgi:hypothetical protein
MINVQIEWNVVSVFAAKFPDFWHHSLAAGWWISYNRVYFAVIAFAFFIPTDASFTLGISTLCLGLFTYVMWKFGVNYTGFSEGSTSDGAHLAFFLVILYLGRHTYWQVLKAAFWRVRGEVDREAVAGMRVFVAAFATLVFLCCLGGLNVWMAFGFVTMFCIAHLVLARVSAETGTPMIQIYLRQVDVFSKVMGTRAVGPYSMAFLEFVTYGFGDAREALTMFLANGFRIADRERVSRFRLGAVISVTLIPCAAIAFLAVLWVQYNGRSTDGWGPTGIPTIAFNQVADAVAELQREPGLLEEVCRIETEEGFFSWEGLRFRLGHWSAKPGALPWILVGFCAVLFCYIMRLRFTWWMIHPILFLMWSTWATRTFAPSFLIGCAIKFTVVRFGGGRMYNSLKPAFYGVILGELVTALGIMIFNVLYYWSADGAAPRMYLIFPP